MTGSEFAQYAETKCGMGASTFRSKMNLGKNTSWSAAFISSCASDCNLLGVVLPKTTKCQEISDKGSSSSYVEYTGSWIPGACSGSDETPQSGDIVLFSWSSKSNNRADSAGIVKGYDASNDSLEVIVGDYGTKGSNNSTVRMITYSKSFKCIKGYFRPNWKEVQ